MKKLKALLSVGIAASLVLGVVSGATAAGKTLTLGAGNPPASFEASQANMGQFTWYHQAVYDTILRKTETAKVIPGIATKWSYNSAGTVLTLTLRKDVKFSDGSALDAAAVVANLNANKSSAGPTAGFLAEMKKATAKSSNVVVISLADRDPAFLEYLAEAPGALQSPKTIGTADAKTNPIGSGPYILDTAKTKVGSQYVYKANPNYWDKKNRAYDGLVIKVITDATAMVNALKTNSVNAAAVAQNSAISTLKSSGLKMVYSYLDAYGIYFADRFGKTVPALGNVKVRQAINLAFDRAAILKAIDSGYGKVTNQIFPSSGKAYLTRLDKTYPYDLEKAKALMAEAGYAKGFDLPFATFAGAFGENIYAIVKDQLGEIGINVVLKPLTAAQFIPDLRAGKYPAYIMQFERSPNTWKFINFIIKEDSKWNSEHYGDATSNSLIGRIQDAGDSANGVLLQKKLNTYLTEQAWFAPFYEKQGTFAFNKSVKIKASQTGNVLPFLYNIK